MVCSGCGTQIAQAERFCRKCGTTLAREAAASSGEVKPVRLGTGEDEKTVALRDPDEMTGNGIGKVIVGDGFLIVAVILSASHTSISSLLWLLLLLPAFFFFGKGFADVLHARQIRRRIKQGAQHSDFTPREVNRAPSIDFQSSISGELPRSVTERTTRSLK